MPVIFNSLLCRLVDVVIKQEKAESRNTQMRNELYLTPIVLVQDMRRRSEYMHRNTWMGTMISRITELLEKLARNHDAASRANVHIASFVLDVVL